ncbi:MAG: hypothetical protein ACRD5K_11040 [Candidatus Acidiferrales bacterium]
MKRGSLLLAALVLLSAVAPTAARADEFKLKDGSTITGTVVGYVGKSFKVKTSYGFALVEKDKIVSIRIAGAPEAIDKKSKSDADKTAAAEKHQDKSRGDIRAEEGSVSKNPASPSATRAPKSELQPSSATSSEAPVTPRTLQPSTVAPSAQATTAATPEPAAPEPQPIREKVTGNTYINDTYDFQMYKPPDWQVMDGARSVLPGAIAAMGTDDQTTYLVVGQEAAGKSAAADIAATEKRLSDILVNFRPLDDEKLTVSGTPVIAHRFRGNVDEQDWSGFMVFVPRGEKLYTIFGMTRADNDLVQIQENVIRRTISSFQFLPQ